MIECQHFFQALQQAGVSYFAGVPDSLLKDMCAYIGDHTDRDSHVIAANEGGALAAVAGYHLATGRIGLVYLQNSGLGNIVNPLTSLTDPEVYSIPLVLLIGWRGEPGVHDEPQHVKQGRVTGALLDALELPYDVLPTNPAEASECVTRAVASALRRQAPHAILVRKNTFSAHQVKTERSASWEVRREEALRVILGTLDAESIVVTTTGMASREVFELRACSGVGHGRDFLTVGCMGHASQIAFGVAQQRRDRQVWCLDGDGAALMHMGALAIAGGSGLLNFKHVIINNGAHDSVGGQPTAAERIDLCAIALACGYIQAKRVFRRSEIESAVQELHSVNGPALLEIRVNRGARSDLSRPTTSPLENKRQFMRHVGAI